MTGGMIKYRFVILVENMVLAVSDFIYITHGMAEQLAGLFVECINRSGNQSALSIRIDSKMVAA